MSNGKMEEIKGRVKEAVGVITGDSKLKRDGQVDQTVGKIKQTASKVVDEVKKATE